MKTINQRGFSHLFLLLLVVVVVGVTGTYLLVRSHARPLTPPDDPARGVSYEGLTPGDPLGPCKHEFETNTHAANGTPACTHPDPGPANVDVRVRATQVDAQMQAEAAYDQVHPPADPQSDPGAAAANTSALLSPNDVLSAGSLGSVTAVNWPCTGTGTDGDRVRMIYVYPSNASSRYSSLLSSFDAIARRMNGVMYYSGMQSGQPRQIRFQTTSGSSGCGLSIGKEQLSASSIGSFSSIETELRNRGYNLNTKKYVVEVDASPSGHCGIADEYLDTTPGSTNYNNGGSGGAMFAAIWKPCWNYGEPHELMHALGAVQDGAPYSTNAGHCSDEHDVMCYKDTSGIAPQIICSNTVNEWRYDCNKNTYFNASTTPSGWIGSNWNTANSSFLDRF